MLWNDLLPLGQVGRLLKGVLKLAQGLQDLDARAELRQSVRAHFKLGGGDFQLEDLADLEHLAGGFRFFLQLPASNCAVCSFFSEAW